MSELDTFRAAYARLVTSIAGVPNDERLIDAFAAVPRERFIGPGPWQAVTRNGYVAVPVEIPAFLYQDFAVGLDPARQLNNGQPSLHAYCFAGLQIRPREKIVHVGAGTGYYSALMARLTGPEGSVIAYEIEPGLAEKAAANLAEYANVSVRNCSGVDGPLPECDVVYVNAGATGPADAWLDALRSGGRLLFPLTADKGFGAMLLVTRTEAGFAARCLCQAAFIHCAGARDEGTSQKLAVAFEHGGLLNFARKGPIWDVKTLHRNSTPDTTCWFAGRRWWLSTAA